MIHYWGNMMEGVFWLAIAVIVWHCNRLGARTDATACLACERDVLLLRHLGFH